MKRSKADADLFGRGSHVAAAALGNTLEENARLFALLNIAMADAAICAWDAKYTFHFWRPVTTIAFAQAWRYSTTIPATPPRSWAVQPHKQVNKIRPPVDYGVWRVTSARHPFCLRDC
jgi:hypothetical protein